MRSVSSKARVRRVRVLSDGWYSLREYTLDYPRRDGARQILTREVCVGGDRAAVLLYRPSPPVVILTRQFRLPPLVAGDPSPMLIEVAGGLVSDEAPDLTVAREAEEETGYRITHPVKVLTAYMNPQLTTERTHLFIAEVQSRQRSSGGGIPAEGEDIEVIEVLLDDAMAMIERGEIVDGKTILLLYHAKHRLP